VFLLPSQACRRESSSKVDVSSETRVQSHNSPTSPAHLTAPLVPDGIELAGHQAGPEFIAVDDHFVYWTNFEDDAVLKIAKDGSGTPIEVSRNDRGENKAIAVDDKALYWGGTSLYQQPKSTGLTRRFNSGSKMIYNLVPSGGRIFWANADATNVQLKSMKSGGTDVRDIGPAVSQDFTFATDGSTAFVGRFDVNADDAGQIEMIRIGGGSPSPFAKTRFVWRITFDSHFVYWLEGRTLGAIMKKDRRGVGHAVALTNGVVIVRPQSFVADANSLYWTDLGTGNGEGVVGKVSKAGGDGHAIARHQIVPQGLAVDDGFVYWVNFGPTKNGTIRKTPK
jgi:hypothetical protein